MRRVFPLSLAMTLSLCQLSAAAPAEKELFPFVISYDAPDTVTNVSSWLPRPAGKGSFIRVVQGHLANDAGPLRFWATNLCFDACFPSHEGAQRVAARLASLGINCVRLHHMDARSIWGKSPNHLTLDPEQLEKLDYLISQLKQQGVYVNINLHVSRWLDTAEGFTGKDKRPNYDKGLDNFEPRMIELQKKYAHDLLTHVNRYTQTAYVNEPAVAFVEINNENALYSSWGWGNLDHLPEPYAGTFQGLWNAWLRKKYSGTAQLAKGWNAQSQPLGKEMLAGADFSQPMGKAWHLEADGDGQCKTTIRDDGPNGQRYLRLEVVRRGSTPWRPQITHAGLAVERGKLYTLSGRLRSDKPHSVSMNCMMAHDPWKHLGLSASAAVEKEWTPFRLSFVAEKDEPQARISFSGFPVGVHDLAELSLRPGGNVGLDPSDRLEEGAVPIIRHQGPAATPAARADWADFLWDTEHDYWQGMYHYLKDELHVRSLVTGTQVGYSPVHIQAGMDYADAHSYWHHPTFPHRPWDSKDWYVVNAALVNSPGGTLARLAGTRIAGMTYTVSEYNHPQPNSYAAEGFPMIAAFGAFQGWDAIYSFAYAHNSQFEPPRLESFFNINSDTAKLAHMPACAALFVRGDVTPARQMVAVGMSAAAERAELRESLNSWSLTAATFKLDPRMALVHGIGLDLGRGAAVATALPPPLPEKTPRFISDTAQLTWDNAQAGAGYFLVDTPRTKLFTGFVAGRKFTLGNVGLSIGATRLDWATVSLVAIDGAGFDRAGRVLLAATGLEQNRNAQLEHLTADHVTLRNHWGDEPILCEGVPAEISLPVPADRVRLYPLDEAGRRRGAIPIDRRDQGALLHIGPEHKTVWYEIEIQ